MGIQGKSQAHIICCLGLSEFKVVSWQILQKGCDVIGLHIDHSIMRWSWLVPFLLDFTSQQIIIMIWHLSVSLVVRGVMDSIKVNVEINEQQELTGRQFFIAWDSEKSQGIDVTFKLQLVTTKLFVCVAIPRVHMMLVSLVKHTTHYREKTRCLSELKVFYASMKDRIGSPYLNASQAQMYFYSTCYVTRYEVI